MKRVLLTISVAAITGLLFGQGPTGLEIKTRSSSVAYSPDNEHLLVASGKDVIIYGTGGTTVLGRLQGHKGYINHVSISNDGASVVSAGGDGTIKLWDMESKQLVRSFNAGKGVVSAAFVGNGKKYIAGITEKLLMVWDVSDGSQIYQKQEHSKPLRALATSADGRFILTGAGDRLVLVRDAESGEVKHRLLAHEGWVRSLAVHPNSKTFVSGGDDKKAKIWNLETGAPVLEIASHKEWVYDLEYSSDGRFIGVASRYFTVYDSERAGVVLKIEKNGAPIVKFSFNPNGSDVATIEDGASKIRFWKMGGVENVQTFTLRNTDDKTPPLIYISNPPKIEDNIVRVSSDIISLEGTTQDESGIRKLVVNGIETPMKSNGRFVIKMPLSMGDNPVNIEVTDINDNIALKKFLIVRRDLDGGEYLAENAKNYLLVIGVDKYQHWPALNNAVRDANAVAQTLITNYNFDFGNVNVLLNGDASRNNILSTLRGYIEKITPQDNFMIYFSGHGHFDELLNEGYWIPQEAEVKTEGDYISNSTILKILENVNSQHTFLVADACFSGSLFSEQSRGYADNVERFRSRWGLASGRLETVSDGAYGQNSPFADAFIEFLNNNDKEKLAVSELIQYVKLTVADKANQTPIGNPLKSLGDEGGEFVFYKRGN